MWQDSQTPPDALDFLHDIYEVLTEINQTLHAIRDNQERDSE